MVFALLADHRRLGRIQLSRQWQRLCADGGFGFLRLRGLAGLFAFAGLAPLGGLFAGALADAGGTPLAFLVAGSVGLVMTLAAVRTVYGGRWRAVLTTT